MAMLLRRRCGFAGVKPLNITFTMARPLPIYPVDVPRYPLLTTPGGVFYEVIGLMSAICCHTWSVHARPHYIRAYAHFFSFPERDQTNGLSSMSSSDCFCMNLLTQREKSGSSTFCTEGLPASIEAADFLIVCPCSDVEQVHHLLDAVRDCAQLSSFLFAVAYVGRALCRSDHYCVAVFWHSQKPFAPRSVSVPLCRELGHAVVDSWSWEVPDTRRPIEWFHSATRLLAPAEWRLAYGPGPVESVTRLSLLGEERTSGRVDLRPLGSVEPFEPPPTCGNALKRRRLSVGGGLTES